MKVDVINSLQRREYVLGVGGMLRLNGRTIQTICDSADKKSTQSEKSASIKKISDACISIMKHIELIYFAM